MTSASRGATLSLENELESATPGEAGDESADGEGADGESGPSEREGWRRADSGESASERRALDDLLAEALVAQAEIVALVGQERAAKARQLRALQRFEAKGYHRALCMSVEDFAVDVGVARTKREAKDLLRTGKHLERVPRIGDAFDAGNVDWTKVRDVGPLLTPETEDVWLPRLSTWTNAQLQARVREEQGLPPLRRISFWVTPVGGANYDQLADNVRRCADRPLTDDDVFEEIVQRGLSGPTPKGEAEPRLGAEALPEPEGEGEAVPEVEAESRLVAEAVPEPEGEAVPEVEAVPRLDAEAVPEPEGEAVPEAEVVVKASTDRLRPSTMVVIHRCDDCKRTTTEGRHGTVSVPEETYELQRCNSATLDRRDGPGRVTRTIPPRTANQVLARDRFRCRVGGCKNRTWIAIHHEGGRAVAGHDPAAMMVLCTFHHMELHRGNMRSEITGETIRFFRRDGVEIRERGPTDELAELPHVGRPSSVLPHMGQVATHQADA